MACNRVLTEAEPLRDVPVRTTRRGKLYDLDLALAQPRAPATLRHKTSALTKIVVAARETGEQLVGAGRAERSERFDSRKPRGKRRRRVVDMPHRDLQEDVRTARSRGEL